MSALLLASIQEKSMLNQKLNRGTGGIPGACAKARGILKTGVSLACFACVGLSGASAQTGPAAPVSIDPEYVVNSSDGIRVAPEEGSAVEADSTDEDVSDPNGVEATIGNRANSQKIEIEIIGGSVRAISSGRLQGFGIKSVHGGVGDTEITLTKGASISTAGGLGQCDARTCSLAAGPTDFLPSHGLYAVRTDPGEGGNVTVTINNEGNAGSDPANPPARTRISSVGGDAIHLSNFGSTGGVSLTVEDSEVVSEGVARHGISASVGVLAGLIDSVNIRNSTRRDSLDLTRLYYDPVTSAASVSELGTSYRCGEAPDQPDDPGDPRQACREQTTVNHGLNSRVIAFESADTVLNNPDVNLLDNNPYAVNSSTGLLEIALENALVHAKGHKATLANANDITVDSDSHGVFATSYGSGGIQISVADTEIYTQAVEKDGANDYHIAANDGVNAWSTGGEVTITVRDSTSGSEDQAARNSKTKIMAKARGSEGGESGVGGNGIFARGRSAAVAIEGGSIMAGARRDSSDTQKGNLIVTNAGAGSSGAYAWGEAAAGERLAAEVTVSGGEITILGETGINAGVKAYGQGGGARAAVTGGAIMGEGVEETDIGPLPKLDDVSGRAVFAGAMAYGGAVSGAGGVARLESGRIESKGYRSIRGLYAESRSDGAALAEMVGGEIRVQDTYDRYYAEGGEVAARVVSGFVPREGGVFSETLAGKVTLRDGTVASVAILQDQLADTHCMFGQPGSSACDREIVNPGANDSHSIRAEFMKPDSSDAASRWTIAGAELNVEYGTTVKYGGGLPVAVHARNLQTGRSAAIARMTGGEIAFSNLKPDGQTPYANGSSGIGLLAESRGAGIAGVEFSGGVITTPDTALYAFSSGSGAARVTMRGASAMVARGQAVHAVQAGLRQTALDAGLAKNPDAVIDIGSGSSLTLMGGSAMPGQYAARAVSMGGNALVTSSGGAATGEGSKVVSHRGGLAASAFATDNAQARVEMKSGSSLEQMQPGDGVYEEAIRVEIFDCGPATDSSFCSEENAQTRNTRAELVISGGDLSAARNGIHVSNADAAHQYHVVQRDPNTGRVASISDIAASYGVDKNLLASVIVNRRASGATEAPIGENIGELLDALGISLLEFRSSNGPNWERDDDISERDLFFYPASKVASRVSKLEQGNGDDVGNILYVPNYSPGRSAGTGLASVSLANARISASGVEHAIEVSSAGGDSLVPLGQGTEISFAAKVFDDWLDQDFEPSPGPLLLTRAGNMLADKAAAVKAVNTGSEHGGGGQALINLSGANLSVTGATALAAVADKGGLARVSATSGSVTVKDGGGIYTKVQTLAPFSRVMSGKSEVLVDGVSFSIGEFRDEAQLYETAAIFSETSGLGAAALVEVKNASVNIRGKQFAVVSVNRDLPPSHLALYPGEDGLSCDVRACPESVVVFGSGAKIDDASERKGGFAEEVSGTSRRGPWKSGALYNKGDLVESVEIVNGRERTRIYMALEGGTAGIYPPHAPQVSADSVLSDRFDGVTNNVNDSDDGVKWAYVLASAAVYDQTCNGPAECGQNGQMYGKTEVRLEGNAAVRGDIYLGAGQDILRLLDQSSLIADIIYLGSGDDILEISQQAQIDVEGVIEFGAGDDSLSITGIPFGLQGENLNFGEEEELRGDSLGLADASYRYYREPEDSDNPERRRRHFLSLDSGARSFSVDNFEILGLRNAQVTVDEKSRGASNGDRRVPEQHSIERFHLENSTLYVRAARDDLNHYDAELGSALVVAGKSDLKTDFCRDQDIGTNPSLDFPDLSCAGQTRADKITLALSGSVTMSPGAVLRVEAKLAMDNPLGIGRNASFLVTDDSEFMGDVRLSDNSVFKAEGDLTVHGSFGKSVAAGVEAGARFSTVTTTGEANLHMGLELGDSSILNVNGYLNLSENDGNSLKLGKDSEVRLSAPVKFRENDPEASLEVGEESLLIIDFDESLESNRRICPPAPGSRSSASYCPLSPAKLEVGIESRVMFGKGVDLEVGGDAAIGVGEAGQNRAATVVDMRNQSSNTLAIDGDLNAALVSDGRPGGIEGETNFLIEFGNHRDQVLIGANPETGVVRGHANIIIESGGFESGFETLSQAVELQRLSVEERQILRIGNGVSEGAGFDIYYRDPSGNLVNTEDPSGRACAEDRSGRHNCLLDIGFIRYARIDSGTENPAQNQTVVTLKYVELIPDRVGAVESLGAAMLDLVELDGLRGQLYSQGGTLQLSDIEGIFEPKQAKASFSTSTGEYGMIDSVVNGLVYEQTTQRTRLDYDFISTEVGIGGVFVIGGRYEIHDSEVTTFQKGSSATVTGSAFNSSGISISGSLLGLTGTVYMPSRYYSSLHVATTEYENEIKAINLRETVKGTAYSMEIGWETGGEEEDDLKVTRRFQMTKEHFVGSQRLGLETTEDALSFGVMVERPFERGSMAFTGDLIRKDVETVTRVIGNRGTLPNAYVKLGLMGALTSENGFSFTGEFSATRALSTDVDSFTYSGSLSIGRSW